jgi:hypothetical protein
MVGVTMARIATHLRETGIIGRYTRESIVSSAIFPQLAVAGLAMVGLSDATVPFAFTRLKPDIVQLLACTAGRGEVWIDGAWSS